MSYTNFNTFKLFENVGINSSNDYMLSMKPNDNNISFHSSNSIDYNNVDIMSIKNIINKKQNEDLNLSSLTGTTINPVITINNNHGDCRIMTNLNVAGNVNIENNLIIPTHSETSNLLANVQGSIYFNTSAEKYEGYVNNTKGWQPLGGGGFSETEDVTIHKNLNVSGNINLTNSCIGYYKKPIFSNINNTDLENYGDSANTDGSGLILESGEPGSTTEGGGIKIVSDGVAIWGPGKNTNPASSKSAIFVVYDEERQTPGLTMTDWGFNNEQATVGEYTNYFPLYQPRFKICKNGWTMINTNHYSKVFKVSRISIKLYEDKYRCIVWDNTQRQCYFKRLSDISGVPSQLGVTSYFNLHTGQKGCTFITLPLNTPKYWSAEDGGDAQANSAGSLSTYGSRILAMFGYEDTPSQNTSSAYLYNNLWAPSGHFWTFDAFCGEPSAQYGNIIIKMEAFVDAENNDLDWTI